MNSPETPDSIDELLRRQEAYIADDGFTRRVMAELPEQNRFLLARIVLTLVVIMGTVMAILWMPWNNLPPLDFTQLFSENSKVLSAWIPFIAVGMALGSAVLAIFRRGN